MSKLADLLGMTNKGSARNAWAPIRAKLFGDDKGGATGQAKATAKSPAKKKAKKAPATSADASDDEAPAPKASSKRKSSVKQEAGAAKKRAKVKGAREDTPADGKMLEVATKYTQHWLTTQQLRLTAPRAEFSRRRKSSSVCCPRRLMILRSTQETATSD